MRYRLTIFLKVLAVRIVSISVMPFWAVFFHQLALAYFLRSNDQKITFSWIRICSGSAVGAPIFAAISVAAIEERTKIKLSQMAWSAVPHQAGAWAKMSAKSCCEIIKTRISKPKCSAIRDFIFWARISSELIAVEKMIWYCRCWDDFAHLWNHFHWARILILPWKFYFCRWY